MKDREGQQPSGVNPEWETDKAQNIAIAKRIESIIRNLQRPNRAVLLEGLIKSGVENLEELNAIDNIEFLKKEGFLDEEDKPAIPREIQKALTNDDIEELTLGYTRLFSHVDNKFRTLVLGVGLCDEAKDSDFLIGSMIIGLPEDFTYPVYVIREEEPVETVQGNNYNVLASTKYGELPSGIIGGNGLSYSVSNVYCFNLFGQGARIEDIYEFDIRSWLSEIGGLSEEEVQRLEREHEEDKRKFLHVDFIPEDGCRAIPLTVEDYAKINKMFEDIDAELYKIPQV